eukprot:6435676-Amphidinium_carterae.1
MIYQIPRLAPAAEKERRLTEIEDSFGNVWGSVSVRPGFECLPGCKSGSHREQLEAVANRGEPYAESPDYGCETGQQVAVTCFDLLDSMSLNTVNSGSSGLK